MVLPEHSANTRFISFSDWFEIDPTRQVIHQPTLEVVALKANQVLLHQIFGLNADRVPRLKTIYSDTRMPLSNI